MQFNIPDKLYFKIGEVGKLAQVPTHVLRYWETEFRGIKPKRANSKQRLYRREDVELILRIKVLLHEQGYTIAGARKLIESGKSAPEIPVREVSPIVPAAVNTVQKKGNVAQALGTIKSELQQLQRIIDKNM
jgi:DNA-binding transcriptional MerR regulator